MADPVAAFLAQAGQDVNTVLADVNKILNPATTVVSEPYVAPSTPDGQIIGSDEVIKELQFGTSPQSIIDFGFNATVDIVIYLEKDNTLPSSDSLGNNTVQFNVTNWVTGTTARFYLDRDYSVKILTNYPVGGITALNNFSKNINLRLVYNLKTKSAVTPGLTGATPVTGSVAVTSLTNSNDFTDYLALLANGSDSTISFYDSISQTVVKTISMPMSTSISYLTVTDDGSYLLATDTLSNTLLILNNINYSLVAQVGLNGGTNPIAIAITPDNKTAFVANNSSNTVSVIDLINNELISTINLSFGTDYSPQGLATAITASSNNNLIAVSIDSNGTTSNYGGIIIIDRASFTIQNSIILQGHDFKDIAISPDSRYVYASSYNGSFKGIYKYDILNLSSSTEIFTDNVQKIALSPDGLTLYATLPLVNEVAIIDADNLVDTNTIYLNGSPLAISVSPDGSQVYSACDNNLMYITDATSLETIASPAISSNIKSVYLTYSFIITPVQPVAISQNALPNSYYNPIYSSLTNSFTFSSFKVSHLEVNSSTAIQLPNNSCKYVLVKNQNSNTNTAYLGDSSVTTTTGIEVIPNQTFGMPLSNSNLLFAIGNGNLVLDIMTFS